MTAPAPASLARFTLLFALLLLTMICAPARAAAQSANPCVEASAENGLPAGAACLSLSFDLRSDYRARSTRREIFVEPDRSDAGPELALGITRIRADRPIARLLVEARPRAELRIGTGSGDPVTASAGLRLQVESPPRRPGDANDFLRTGRRALVERLSVEWKGLAVGVLPSAFYFAPGLTYTTAYAAEQSGAAVRYTIAPAQDLRLILSLENGSRRRLVDPAWGSYRGDTDVDPIVAVQKDAGWGTVQLAGGLHPVRAQARAPGGAELRGKATGWAVMAAAEGWFEWSLGSGEVSVNLSATRGALDYLNATNYPADFAVDTNGRPRLASGQAGVFALANSWTRRLRTVVSISAVRTALRTERFRLRNNGMIGQAALEFRPNRGLVLGVELGHIRDRVHDGAGARASNRYWSMVGYVRQRFRARPLRIA